jgi:magnesium transporter
MNAVPEHLDQPVRDFIRKDFAQLRESMTAREALDAVREKGIGEKIVYFYVVDENARLVGVLPTRRLLTAALDQRIGDLMIKRIIAIPQTATLLEACEFFVLHKFLAFPVVDEERRILGLIDIGVFTEEVFDIAEREQHEDILRRSASTSSRCAARARSRRFVIASPGCSRPSAVGQCVHYWRARLRSRSHKVW